MNSDKIVDISMAFADMIHLLRVEGGVAPKSTQPPDQPLNHPLRYLSNPEVRGTGIESVHRIQD